MKNIIEIKKLRKTYNDEKAIVLKDIDLEIYEGSFNAIIGQSGSGKSTLLNIIGSLDKKTSGKLVVAGYEIDTLSKKDISEFRNSEIGFIFQFHHLLPEFTVIENVLMPYSISGKKVNKEVRAKAEFLIDRVGLNDVKNKYTNEISGGQQQRTAIARALINNPKIILADEPTGSATRCNMKSIA